MKKSAFSGVLIGTAFTLLLSAIFYNRTLHQSAGDKIYSLLHPQKKQVVVFEDSERLFNPELVQRYYERYGYANIWTDSTLEVLTQMLRDAESLGLEENAYHGGYINQFDSLLHIRNKNLEFLPENELIFTDAALSFLFRVAYGQEVNTSYNGVKLAIDTTLIFNQFDSLLVRRNWQSIINRIEPGNKVYRILKNELNQAEAALPNSAKPDSLKECIAQLKESLNCWRWIQRVKDHQFALVNIPSAELRVMNPDSVYMEMKVIVGKTSTPTPVFTSYITGIVIYPYWTVPYSIATKEMLPKIKINLSYLDDNDLQVINNKGKQIDPATIEWKKLSSHYFPYILRQSTGCDNSLGLLKFELNAPFSIYLHDTNAKSLFNRKNRYLSHGCIRLEKPVELATYILGEGPELRRVDSLYHCENNLQPVYISLKKYFPVLVLYMTADVDENGNVVFYNDIYSKKGSRLPQ